MAQHNKKIFNLRNGLKALNYRNKDYYDRLDDDEKKAYSPYLMMRYMSNIIHKDNFFVEHHIEMVNQAVNKHLFAIGRHKKLLWLLTSMTGTLSQQYHQWLKPMKRTYKLNDGVKKLLEIYPNKKESDLATLDKILTDDERKEIILAHGKDITDGTKSTKRN